MIRQSLLLVKFWVWVHFLWLHFIIIFISWSDFICTGDLQADLWPSCGGSVTDTKTNCWVRSQSDAEACSACAWVAEETDGQTGGGAALILLLITRLQMLTTKTHSRHWKHTRAREARQIHNKQRNRLDDSYSDVTTAYLYLISKINQLIVI